MPGKTGKVPRKCESEKQTAGRCGKPDSSKREQRPGSRCQSARRVSHPVHGPAHIPLELLFVAGEPAPIKPKGKERNCQYQENDQERYHEHFSLEKPRLTQWRIGKKQGHFSSRSRRELTPCRGRKVCWGGFYFRMCVEITNSTGHGS